MEPKQTEKVITKRKSKEEWKEQHKGKDLEGLNFNLMASERPGYVRRFVKDNPRRIAQMLERGYEFAKEGDNEICGTIEGSRLGAELGITREGPGTKGFLMETPIENYEALQELKQEPIDAVEQEMRTGHHTEKPGDRRYIAGGGISIGKK